MSTGSREGRSYAEIEERFVRLERDTGLLDIEIDGWCAWPIVRFSTALALYDLELGRKSKSRPTARELAAMASRAIRFPRHYRGPSGGIAGLYGTHHRAIEKDGTWEHPDFDEVLKKSQGDIIEVVTNQAEFSKRSRHARIASQYTSDAIRLLSELDLRRLDRSPAQKAAAELEAILAEEFKTGGVPSLAGPLTRFQVSRRRWSSFFSKAHPEWLLVLCHYSLHGIIAGAREQGVRIAEMQHGSLPRIHLGYSWASETATAKSRMTVPDRILTYGAIWSDELRARGFWTDEPAVVGNARITQARSAPTEPLADPVDQAFPRLLITAQGTKSHDDDLIAWGRAFLRDHPRGHLTIKLHPGTPDPSDYRHRFSGEQRVEIVGGRDQRSVYDLIRKCSVHASVYSTCHFDAVSLGVPTIVMAALSNSQLMEPFRDAAGFHWANSPSEFTQLIGTLEGNLAQATTKKWASPYSVEDFLRALPSSR